MALDDAYFGIGACVGDALEQAHDAKSSCSDLVARHLAAVSGMHGAASTAAPTPCIAERWALQGPLARHARTLAAFRQPECDEESRDVGTGGVCVS